MKRLFGSALTLIMLSSILPAAAGEIDGKWQCLSFGKLIATIGIRDADYVVANNKGASGRGTLTGDAAGFTVDNGALLDDLEIQSGRLSFEFGAPMLRLASRSSGILYCDQK